jgi:oxygen-dependent protoporphyrinogen oxidase
MAYRDGMDTLARALADRVDVTIGCPVRAVEPEGAGATVHFADGTARTARHVVLAVPAPTALELHTDVPEDERPYLAASTFTPMLKVACLLDRPLPSPTRSPSYVLSVPATESRVFAGAILDHLKVAGRAPRGRGLVSLFVAPWASPELLDAPDEQVVSTVCAEAERYLPGLGEATRATVVHRFRHGLPEATPQALRLRAAFLQRPLRAVEYAGDWVMLRPSSEGAIRSAGLAVDRILRLAATRRHDLVLTTPVNDHREGDQL